MTSTVNNKIPFVPESTTDPAAGLNLSLVTIDALLQAAVISVGDNDPPSEAMDGDRYIIGASPTGEWAAHANELAMWIEEDSAWMFRPALIVFSQSDAAFWAFVDGEWSKFASVPGTPAHYGQRSIAGNTTVIAVTAAVDSTLSTNSDYIQVTGIFGIAPDGENNGVTQQTNSFTIARDGPYRIEFWANCKSNTNNTQLAFKFAVNGVIQAVRRPKIYMRNVGEVHGGSAFSYVELQAGDVLTLWIASTQSANVTIEDAVFGVVSLTGTQEVGFGEVLSDVEIVEYNETTATAASGTILRADGGIQGYTMTANTAFTFDLTDGQSLTLHLNGGDTWTATWPTITWVGGAAPTLTAADVLEFWYFNATLFGAYVGDV